MDLTPFYLRLGIDAAKSLEGVAQEDEQRFN